MYRPKYFILQELVSETVFNRYGEQAWQFFDDRLLITLDIIKELVDYKTITINNWYWEGILDERGFRENLCSIVLKKTLEEELYVSPHTVGKAIDFDVEGMTADEVRCLLTKHRSSIPYTFRLEKNVPWVHFDLYWVKHKLFTVLND